MPNGQFVLPGGSSTELNEAQAKQLSVVFAHTFGRWLAVQWSLDHGKDVDVDALVACGRAFYARSAFDEKSFGATSASVRTLFDAKWLVTLCGAGGQPEVSVAVSADAKSLQIVDGHIRGLESGEFNALGIPPYVREVPPAPEGVAAVVAHATSRHIGAVPELVLPPAPYPPQLAKWRLVVDQPISARAAEAAAAVSTSELYYGFGQTWRTLGLLVGSRRAEAREIKDLVSKDNHRIALLPGYADNYKSAEVLPQ